MLRVVPFARHMVVRAFVSDPPPIAVHWQRQEEKRLMREENKRINELLASKLPGEVKLADFLDGGKGPGRRKKRKVAKNKTFYFGVPGREEDRDINLGASRFKFPVCVPLPSR